MVTNMCLATQSWPFLRTNYYGGSRSPLRNRPICVESASHRSGPGKGIFCQRLFIQIKAKSRLVGQREAAADHAHDGEAHPFLPDLVSLSRVHAATDLLSQKIGGGGVYVHRCHPADWSLAGVRRHGNIGQGSHLPDLPQSGDAADVVNIGLQNVNDSHLNEFTGAVVSDETFSSGDGSGGSARHARHSCDVFRRARFLDEEQLQRLNFLNYDGCHARAGLGVEVYRNVNVRPQSFAEKLHAANCFVNFLVSVNPFVVAGNSRLYACHADLSCTLADRL